MRTTLDIPDELGKRVKLTAIRRGSSMKDLIVTALEHELSGRRQQDGGKTLHFPLVPSGKPASYDLKPEEISEILIREEIAAYEAVDRR